MEILKGFPNLREQIKAEHGGVMAFVALHPWWSLFAAAVIGGFIGWRRCPQ